MHVRHSVSKRTHDSSFLWSSVLNCCVQWQRMVIDLGSNDIDVLQQSTDYTQPYLVFYVLQIILS